MYRGVNASHCSADDLVVLLLIFLCVIAQTYFCIDPNTRT